MRDFQVVQALTRVLRETDRSGMVFLIRRGSITYLGLSWSLGSVRIEKREIEERID